uniref:Uncharacterized protein n=1 Tax=Arundo donax TaxID=35708 RepID=A0A0A8XRN5_ARUDO
MASEQKSVLVATDQPSRQVSLLRLDFTT